MFLSKDDIPVRIDVPGATARQLVDFGEPSGRFGAEYFSLGAGTDMAPLLIGLENDLCQSAHWGYMISGDVVVTYGSGETERCRGGDVFHWPADHTVMAAQDSEIILFSPDETHGQVIDHVLEKINGG